jgi:DNA modification methylase
MEYKNKILVGDCLEELKTFPDNSIDSVVTDAPYGLSKEPDINEVLTKWLAGEDYKHKGSGFMGKTWDSFVPGPSIWKEVFRVLKPGGHLLCFAGTRTEDLMSIAIRMAGFERRDVIEWLYMSGFPKAMDVGKQFDKRKGGGMVIDSLREYLNQKRIEKGLSPKDIDKVFGFKGNMSGPHWFYNTSQVTIPKKEHYCRLKQILDLDDRFDELIEEAEREKIGEVTKGSSPLPGNHDGTWTDGQKDGTFDITAPSTDLAKQWDGWKTALKPAHEPILMFRKPLEKNVCYNVEKYGTGALNIRESEIGPEKRFPANCVTLDDDQFYSKYFNITPEELSKKANKKDRNSDWEGNQLDIKNGHPTVKPVELMAWLIKLVTQPGGIVLDPFAGSGSTLVAAKRHGFNFVGVELNEEYAEIAKKRCGID